MTANELIASLREMKKTNPAEYEIFQKNYADEMTEGVAYWSVNDGYISLWKLHEEVEDFNCWDFTGLECFGDEFGGFKGLQKIRTITKKKMEREDFYKEEEESVPEPVKKKPEIGDETEESPRPIIWSVSVRVETDESDAEPEIGDNKKAMKAYIKARMNYLMGKSKDCWDQCGGEENGEACDFTLKSGWDEEEFDNLLCSLCEERQVNLNENQHHFDFAVVARNKHNNKWEVSVEWDPIEPSNPFEDFHDEDEEMIDSDSDDE